MQVLVLTQDQCQFCAQARTLLERLATEYGFRTVLLDISTPEGEALALESGILFPPGIFIDGEPICYGRPSERRLRKELQRRRAEGEHEIRRERG